MDTARRFSSGSLSPRAGSPEPAPIETLTSFPSSWLAARSTGAMDPGSVLFHAPSAVFQSPGGGENQLVQTGRHLEELGQNVRPFNAWTDRLEDARLLHLFGMSREGLELARVARARHVRVVLSPICWVEPRAIAAQAPNRAQGAWQLAKWGLKSAAPRWPTWRRALLRLAHAVLPNSKAEARQLVRLFGTDPKRVHVVPNGVSQRFASSDPAPFRARFGRRGFVLYTGRIEPRKNVHTLVRATRTLGLPLVVFGDAPAGLEEYRKRCVEAAGPQATWLSAVEHDDPLLASAYAAARVFALPSWFETPGLSALEAALAGCAVVLTPNGSTREYFGDRVEYARPDRPSEIRDAIVRAWVGGPQPGLASHVRDHFLWPAVARRTAEVYDQIAP
ncbi:MAG: glycosyltransferase [Isosphaeraceae bacterium]|nr:glycosyltransferase [Isosphaeraceae bacterium]